MEKECEIHVATNTANSFTESRERWHHLTMSYDHLHITNWGIEYLCLAAWSNSAKDLVNARRNLVFFVKIQFDRLRLIWKNILITSKSIRSKNFPGQFSKNTSSRFRAPKQSNWASKLSKYFKKEVSKSDVLSEFTTWSRWLVLAPMLYFSMITPN